MLASPAMLSPATTATASGRNSPISMVSAASATNRPFSVIERKKSGASAPGLDSELLTDTEISTGTAASTRSPAWLRRRPGINRSSERRKRGETAATGRRTTYGVVAGVGASATDIEALPGQRDEHVLERRPPDAIAGDGDPGVHARGDDLLRSDVAQQAGRRRAGGVHLGQAELPHHPSRLVGLIGLDGRLGGAVVAQLRARPLGDQPTDVHHAEVRAHRVDLAEEVARDQHGRPVTGQRPDQLPDLARA